MIKTKWLAFIGVGLAASVLFLDYQSFSSERFETSILHFEEDAIDQTVTIKEERSESVDYLPSSFNNSKLYERVVEFSEGEISEDPRTAYGSVIEKSISELKELSLRLEELDEVDSFVIIEEFKELPTDYSWLDYGLRTPFGKIALADEVGQAQSILVDKEFERSLGANLFSPLIKYYFPEAKVRLLLVKSGIDNNSIQEISSELQEHENTYVLAFSGLASGVDKRVAKFQNAHSKNIIESFDYRSVDEANVQSPSAIKVLLKFLQDKNELEGLNLAAERKVHVLAFGDMMLGRFVRTLMDRAGDKNYIFENIEGVDGKFFSGTDIVHGNLEGPIKGKGKSGGTSMNFSFNEDIAPFLKEKGFDLLSISNNHAVDQGWEGRETTIEALEKSEIDWCGHPSEADPNSVHYGQVGWSGSSASYAFVCLHDVTFKLDDDAAVRLIEEVSEKVDLVVVSIHWGYEYKHTADYSKQIEPARRFVDAGADFVIGHHPHVVQNFEVYKGKYIFYSLGNFVFDQYWSVATQEQLALGIILGENDTEVHLIPMKSEMSQSRLMTVDESKSWIEKFLKYGEYTEQQQESIRQENLL